MSSPNHDPFLSEFLAQATSKARELTSQRCSRLLCGLTTAFLYPPTISAPDAVGVTWLENMQHGIACQFEDCPMSGMPITEVFTDALEQTVAETGMIGIIKSPDVQNRRSAN